MVLYLVPALTPTALATTITNLPHQAATERPVTRWVPLSLRLG